MLVLTRKIGECIRIGDVVVVRVLEVRGSQVRIGVEAPSDVRIYREEIYRPERQADSVGSPAGHVGSGEGNPEQGHRRNGSAR